MILLKLACRGSGDMMKRIAYGVVAGFFLFLAAASANAAERTVMAVMFDGFAPAMIDVHPTVMVLLGLKPGNPVDGHAVDAALVK